MAANIEVASHPRGSTKWSLFLLGVYKVLLLGHVDIRRKGLLNVLVGKKSSIALAALSIPCDIAFSALVCDKHIP